MDREELVRRATALLKADSRVEAAYLFGSLATGRETPLSDIDLAVLLTRVDMAELVAIVKALTIALSRKLDSLKVDLVCLNFADLPIRFSVIKNGTLLFERNPRVRIRFEEQTVKEYIDMVPLWEEYDRYMLQRIKEGRFGA